MYDRDKSYAQNIISCINLNIEEAKSLDRNNSYVMTLNPFDFSKVDYSFNHKNLIGHAKIVWDYCKCNKLRPILIERCEGYLVYRYMMIQLKPNLFKRMIMFPLLDLLLYFKQRNCPIICNSYSSLDTSNKTFF